MGLITGSANYKFANATWLTPEKSVTWCDYCINYRVNKLFTGSFFNSTFSKMDISLNYLEQMNVITR